MINYKVCLTHIHKYYKWRWKYYKYQHKWLKTRIYHTGKTDAINITYTLGKGAKTVSHKQKLTTRNICCPCWPLSNNNMGHLRLACGLRRLLSSRSRGRLLHGGGAPRVRLRFSPLDSSTRTRQPHSVLLTQPVIINHQSCIRTNYQCIFKIIQMSAYLPSSSRTASVASLGSSNSTKAKPGGFLATQTLRRGP